MWYHGGHLSKKEKLLRKAIESPENLRFNELKTLLSYYGFEWRRTKGDHGIYKNKKCREILNIQPDKNDKSKAKKYQVDKFIATLKKNGFLED